MRTSKPIHLPTCLRRLPARATLAVVWALGSWVTASLPATAEERDPQAVEVAQEVLEALGGQQAWDAVRTVRFSFAGFRTHTWDKVTGQHRLEGKTRDGATYVVLSNVHDQGKGEGSAWKNGEETTGEERAKLLELAYGAWINDYYWLLMPYKLLDPGVNLALEGSEELDGQPHHKLRMTFEGVGLTPGDTYWVWVDQESHRVTRWAYVLESFEEGQEATAWTWEGWEQHSGVWLPTQHRLVGGDRELPTDNIGVYGELPASVFTSPEPVDPLVLAWAELSGGDGGPASLDLYS